MWGLILWGSSPKFMSFSLIGGGYGDVLLVPFNDLQKRGGVGGRWERVKVQEDNIILGSKSITVQLESVLAVQF